MGRWMDGWMDLSSSCHPSTHAVKINQSVHPSIYPSINQSTHSTHTHHAGIILLLLPQHPAGRPDIPQSPRAGGDGGRLWPVRRRAAAAPVGERSFVCVSSGGGGVTCAMDGWMDGWIEGWIPCVWYGAIGLLLPRHNNPPFLGNNPPMNRRHTNIPPGQYSIDRRHHTTISPPWQRNAIIHLSIHLSSTALSIDHPSAATGASSPRCRCGWATGPTTVKSCGTSRTGEREGGRKARGM